MQHLKLVFPFACFYIGKPCMSKLSKSQICIYVVIFWGLIDKYFSYSKLACCDKL